MLRNARRLIIGVVALIVLASCSGETPALVEDNASPIEINAETDAKGQPAPTEASTPVALPTEIPTPTAVPPTTAPAPTATAIPTPTPSPVPGSGQLVSTGLYEVLLPDEYLVLTSGSDIETALRAAAPFVAGDVPEPVIENAIAMGEQSEFMALQFDELGSDDGPTVTLSIPDLPPPPAVEVLVEAFAGREFLLPSGNSVIASASEGPPVSGHETVRVVADQTTQIWVLHPQRIFMFNFAFVDDQIMTEILDSFVAL